MKMFYNVANSLIRCAKEARASIVLNIEWVQFVLQNCEMSVWWKKQRLSACLHGVGGARSSGLVSFVFTLWGTQKKPTPLDRGPPLHVNRV